MSLARVMALWELARREALSRRLRIASALAREVAGLLEALDDEVGRPGEDDPASEAIRRVMEDR